MTIKFGIAKSDNIANPTSMRLDIVAAQSAKLNATITKRGRKRGGARQFACADGRKVGGM